MVKEDHISAIQKTLTVADTPVSSPTLQRKGQKHADEKEKDPSKVIYNEPLDGYC